MSNKKTFYLKILSSVLYLEFLLLEKYWYLIDNILDNLYTLKYIYNV